MAKVNVQLLGGEMKTMEATKVSDLKEALDIPSTHEAFVNGEAASDSTKLADYNHVSFAKKQEGAA